MNIEHHPKKEMLEAFIVLFMDFNDFLILFNDENNFLNDHDNYLHNFEKKKPENTFNGK